MILTLMTILAVADFSGIWETTYGDMVLEQDSSLVSGWYSFGGMSTIEGIVSAGGKFVFSYNEGNATGTGWFQLSDSGTSFSGEWKADGDLVWSSWEGHRPTGTSSTWVLILEAEWQESMRENEYSFGEMLDAWLGRLPDIQIRHRFIHDLDDIRGFCIEAATLPGDVYLIFASHGTTAGISLNSGTVSPHELAEALAPMNNLQLVHFSCCEIMAGNTDEAILNSRSNWAEDFAVSGYTTSVDWGGSAIIEFYYLNQILENGLTPVEAAGALMSDIRFSGTTSTHWMEAASFQIQTP
ncbi:MAG: hypothetical protein K8S62_09640 [Candidatus Sabulitectum sp.]|nr:hypothetical protein [Candidatus Sabulitectum sp.]